MTDDTRISERDKTLINILERLADQLQSQDVLLEEIFRQQGEFSKDAVNAKLHRSSLQKDMDISLEKLRESISRYRGDMFDIVREQDNINKNISELNKLVHKSTYSVEDIKQKLSEVDERLIKQEKKLGDHDEHSQRHAEAIPREISDVAVKVTKLHADTEKRLGELHRETQRQLEKLQKDTVRRLLALGSIETALQTLLVRTEPPEKKPSFIVRFFKRLGGFFRITLPRLIKEIRARPED